MQSALSRSPALCKASFVAPSAAISGNVTVGENSSVWYGSTLRGLIFILLCLWVVGDVADIEIGSNTHICDNVVVHVDSPPNQIHTHIGNNVVIEKGSIIHACDIDDNCLIGEGVTVLDGAHICEGAAIAPGSVVTPRKTVGSGEVGF